LHIEEQASRPGNQASQEDLQVDNQHCQPLLVGSKGSPLGAQLNCTANRKSVKHYKGKIKGYKKQ